MKKGVFGLAILVAAAVAIACFVCLAGASTFVPETNQDELSTLLEGCRSAVAAVHSGQGKAIYYQWSQTDTGGVRETETAYQVVFLGERFKLTAEEKFIKNLPAEPLPTDAVLISPGSTLTRQVAFDGEKVTRFTPQSNEATVGDRRTSFGRIGMQDFENRVSVIGDGLLNPETWTKLGPPHYIRSAPRIVGRENIEGDDCVVLEMTLTRQADPGQGIVHTFWFWVNPAKGFTVPRKCNWIKGGTYPEKTLLSETEVAVRQYADGLWGPAKETVTGHRLNSTSGEYFKDQYYVTTYDADLQINAPVSDSELTLTLPSGTTVTNELLQETYTFAVESQAVGGQKVGKFILTYVR